MTGRVNAYRIARAVQDVRSLSTPERALRRAKNKAVGRALGRAGIWRLLWGRR